MIEWIANCLVRKTTYCIGGTSMKTKKKEGGYVGKDKLVLGPYKDDLGFCLGRILV